MNKWLTYTTLVTLSMMTVLSAHLQPWAQESGRKTNTESSTNQPRLVVQLTNPGGGDSVLSPDGQLVVSGGCFWDVATGREIRCLGDQKHTKRRVSSAFSPDGQLLVTGGDNGTARVWEGRTGREVRRFEHPRGFSSSAPSVHNVTFSPDSRFIVTNTGRATYVWDITTGEEVRHFEEYGIVGNVAVAPDGRFVLTVNLTGHSSELRLRDMVTGKEVQRFTIFPPQIGAKIRIGAVTFSPDGRFVLASSSGAERTVYMWEIATGREMRRFDGHTGSIYDMTFSSDGRLVLTLEGKSLDTGQSLAGEVSPLGAVLQMEGKRPGTEESLAVYFWDVATGREIRRLEGYVARNIRSASFASFGRFLLIDRSSDDLMTRRLSLVDTTTGQEVQRIESVASNVSFAAFAPNGRWVLVGSDNEDLRLWDITTGQAVYRFAERIGFSKSFAFSPDSRLIITAGYQYFRFSDWKFNDFARLWDVATGQEIRRFVGHNDGVQGVAFSPDGRFVVTGSKDGTARVWEVATGQEIRRFLHDFPVTTVAFSPNGQFVLTTDHYQVRLWEVSTGVEVWSVRRVWGEKPEETLGYFEMFSFDGRFVMTRWGRIVYLLDATTGQAIRSFQYASCSDVIGMLPDNILY